MFLGGVGVGLRDIFYFSILSLSLLCADSKKVIQTLLTFGEKIFIHT